MAVNPSDRPSAQALLEHSAWIKKLARSLVRCDAGADDVVQDTFVAALEHRPSDERPLRSWLSEVARNFARKARRSSAHREARERRAARAEATPSAAELCERAALHRDLVEAVMALDEPYRSTLLLRYFEELPPSAIAKRDGIPVRTVHTRIQRALSKLRERFDREHDGDRGAWLSALAPLASRPGALGTWTVGATIMNAKLVMLSAMLAALAILAAFFAWRAGSGGIREDMVAVDGQSAVDRTSASTPDLERAVDAPLAERAAATPSTPARPAAASEIPQDSDHELTGIVTNTRGILLAGAHVEVWRNEHRGLHTLDVSLRESAYKIAETSSDEHGEFRVPLPLGRPFDLRVRSAGYALWTLTQRYAGDRVCAVLTAPCSIFGRVTRARDGSPYAGASITAISDTRNYADRSEIQAFTDEHGEYRLDGLAAVGVRIVVRGPFERPSEVELTLAEGESIEHDFALERDAFFVGFVTDARTHMPIADALVESRSYSGAVEVHTDADGRYVLRGACGVGHANPFFLRAEAPGHASLRKRVEGLIESWSPLDFELSPARSVRGRVLGPDGWPVVGAAVLAFSDRYADWSIGADASSTRTAIDGTFEIADLRPEVRHTLFLRKDGLSSRVYDFPSSELERDVVDIGDIRLAEPATITGRVVDENGAPIPDALTRLYGFNSDRGYYSGREVPEIHSMDTRQDGRTDDHGRFSFTDLAGGDYVVAVELCGLGAATQRALRIRSEETLEGLEIAVARGLSVEGRVLDPSGDAVAYANVEIWGEPPAPEHAAHDLTRADGSFRLLGLAEGAYAIRVGVDFVRLKDPATPLSPGRWTGIRAGTRDLRLVLSGTQSIRGRVLGFDDGFVPDAYVYAMDLVDGPDAWPIASTRSDLEGRFELKVAIGSHVNVSAIKDTDGPASARAQSRWLTTRESVAAGAEDVVLKFAKP